MSLRDCAQALRLPVRLLEKLEADDYQGIDYSVYLKGYLSKYARHIRLDEAHVQAQLQSLQTRQPELVASQSVPAWKRGMLRYSSAATGVVLTAVIVVPLIWLGLHGVLKRDVARLAPLDASPVNAQSTRLVQTSTVDPQRQTPPETSASDQPDPPVSPGPAKQRPLMASMAPFSAMENAKPADQPTAETSTPVAPVAKSPATRLAIKLEQPSWVEITDASGARLEYALLPAGASKAYTSSTALDVRIGNAEGASVHVDGKALELDRFRRAKVAHFEVGKDGGVRPGDS